MINNLTISVTSWHLVVKCTLSLGSWDECVDYTVYGIDCHTRNRSHYTLFREVMLGNANDQQLYR